jgi:DNA-binding transcriptional LysR family regulator
VLAGFDLFEVDHGGRLSAMGVVRPLVIVEGDPSAKRNVPRRSAETTAGLLAFEAVARHLSFRRAATELNITQGAVSQRIKTLETVLCQPLFHRNGNVVALTSEGLEFLPNARAILRDIFNATDRLVHKDSTSVLTIGCISTFAIKCLIPAIGDFTDENPEIEVRIRTPVPFEKSNFFDYDLTIQYGFADRWPSMVVTGLGEEELFPVCSPDYLRRAELGSDVKALSQITIIRTATIYPAAINTELLTMITDKNTAEAFNALYDQYGISPDRIASVVEFAVSLPEDTTVNEFTVGPANQPWSHNARISRASAGWRKTIAAEARLRARFSAVF